MKKSLIVASLIAVPSTMCFAVLPTFTDADRLLEVIAYPAFPGIYVAVVLAARAKWAAVAIAGFVNLLLYWALVAGVAKLLRRA